MNKKIKDKVVIIRHGNSLFNAAWASYDDEDKDPSSDIKFADSPLSKLGLR